MDGNATKMTKIFFNIRFLYRYKDTFIYNPKQKYDHAPACPGAKNNWIM